MLVTMPGKSFRGALPDLTAGQQQMETELRRHVEVLAGKIGERNVVRRAPQLSEAADYIEKSLRTTNCPVASQPFAVGRTTCRNIECVVAGKQRPEAILVVGAHYDTVVNCAGANDNGSGVASLLVLASRIAESKPGCTVRFVAFANEEAPYFGTRQMGSWHYASGCKQRQEHIVGMISLETVGYFSSEKDSQRYPQPFGKFYPSTGDFIGFVGNIASRQLVQKCVASFREHARFPSEGGALPPTVDGVGWSDHWSFWQQGYQALMVTDTAPFRYPHYHRATDTPDRLDYRSMSRVVDGLQYVIADLASDGAGG